MGDAAGRLQDEPEFGRDLRGPAPSAPSPGNPVEGVVDLDRRQAGRVVAEHLVGREVGRDRSCPSTPCTTSRWCRRGCACGRPMSGPGRLPRAARLPPSASPSVLEHRLLAVLGRSPRAAFSAVPEPPRLARLAFSASIRSMILVCGASLRLGGNLLALDLLLDGLEHPLAHRVAVVLGMELVGGGLLDQLPGERQLARPSPASPAAAPRRRSGSRRRSAAAP